MTMTREKSLAIVGGTIGVMAGAVLGTAVVSMSQDLSQLTTAQKATLVVGCAAGAGLIVGGLMYLSYGPMTET